MKTLELKGLRGAPAQVFGALRLLPLLRDQVPSDLRLGLREHKNPISVVAVGDRTHYASYVPNALIAQYSDDGQPLAALGSQLLKDGEKPRCFGVQRLQKMVKREGENVMRFLPMHLAMESFMAMCFAGPEIAWPEYTKRVLRHGLSPRIEYSFSGGAISGLDDALRMFEIHDGQVGMALFCADALASVFVVPHPEDYRALHRSLLKDFFGELIWHYSRLYDESMTLSPPFDASRVSNMATLKAEVARARLHWDEAYRLLFGDVLGTPVNALRVTTFSHFTLERFATTLAPDNNCHIGETIRREDGRIEYMKTYRLSASQARRGFLLQSLAQNAWHIDDTAAALKCSRRQLIERLEHAGFGSLIKPEHKKF